jgi:hypothetical protein
MKSKRKAEKQPKAKQRRVGAKPKQPKNRKSFRAKISQRSSQLGKQRPKGRIVRDPAGFYAMLGVTPDATDKEIVSSFELILRVGRENNVGFIEEAATQAFSTLSNPKKRRAYDAGYGKRRSRSDLKLGPLLAGLNTGFRGMVGGASPMYEKPKTWWERLLD